MGMDSQTVFYEWNGKSMGEPHGGEKVLSCKNKRLQRPQGCYGSITIFEGRTISVIQSAKKGSIIGKLGNWRLAGLIFEEAAECLLMKPVRVPSLLP